MSQYRLKSDLPREEILRREMVRLLPRLRRFARSLARDHEKADDLVQASCERALDRLDQVVEGTRFESWLFRIIYTRWIDRLRRGQTRSDHLVVLAGEHVTDVAGAEAARRLASTIDIKTALGALPAEHRAAITLTSVEGYSYEEAASVLCVPVGTVASRVARARTMLAKILAQGRRRDLPEKKLLKYPGQVE